MTDTVFSFQSKDNNNCLLAVPKKGRLYDRVMKLLQGAGLDHHRPARLDVAECTGLPVTIVFLPASDIASYVGEGNVDIGITGVDVVEESGVLVDRILVGGSATHSLTHCQPSHSTYYRKYLTVSFYAGPGFRQMQAVPAGPHGRRLLGP